MPRRPMNLSLPQGLVDEAESSGGSAGEMLSMAPLPVWGSGSANAAAAGQQRQQQQPAPAPQLAESPKSKAKSREQLDVFNARPQSERVHELSTALLREYLAKHAPEVPELRDAFERAFPRNEQTVTRRSVICSALGSSEPPKTGDESILEALVRQIIAPKALSMESGVFGPESAASPDLGAAGANPSVCFGMSPDGTQINVNGLNVGQATQFHAFRVSQLSDLDLEHADIVGKGAGGRVLRALHIPTQEKVAVKEIYLGSDDVIKQIEAEISVMWGTSNRWKDTIPSPFLVNCQGIFYHDGTLYIVMELMDGSLKDALDAHGPFSEEHLKAMAYQILHGLQYMHFDKRQLHRDIKPHNILYNRNGWVKLSDFGIASERMATVGAAGGKATFCGTLVYMSPGRAEGVDNYGFEGDIWSFGVTLYQMATGTLPTGNNLFEVIQLKDSPPQLPTSGVYSDAFRDFISVCLDPQATSQTVSVRQLLMHPWIAQMSLEKSQRLINEVFREVATRTQRAAQGLKPVGLGKRDDFFATIDQCLDDV